MFHTKHASDRQNYSCVLQSRSCPTNFRTSEIFKWKQSKTKKQLLANRLARTKISLNSSIKRFPLNCSYLSQTGSDKTHEQHTREFNTVFKAKQQTNIPYYLQDHAQHFNKQFLSLRHQTNEHSNIRTYIRQ